MLAACMPHCPAVATAGAGGVVRDNTDMLPALEGEEVHQCLFKRFHTDVPEPFNSLHVYVPISEPSQVCARICLHMYLNMPI